MKHRIHAALRALAPLILLTAPAAARGAPPAAAPTVELVMLGTAGGPNMRKDRSEPATLLRVGGATYLLDCGIGTLRRMVEAGIDSTQLSAIFITHLHPDHVLDLAAIMSNDLIAGIGAGGAGPRAIYGPVGIAALVDAAVRYISMPYAVFADGGLIDPRGRPMADYVASKFAVHEIAAGTTIYRDDHVRVSAIENTHYRMMPATARAREKSYAYRFDTPAGSIVFTGDTGASAPLAAFAKGADVLGSEVIDPRAITGMMQGIAAKAHWSPEALSTALGHMTEEHLPPAAVADLAREAGVGTIVLTHIVPGMDGDAALAADDVRAIKAGFKGEVIAARDLDRLCLTRGANGRATLAPCR